eukprot:TRINITY_DN75015_c0_g1_i1.p1 TRINITY_DN75015_c0_g1~~TRINITY_DN75015_c0_g1_i1.p1  ORF type:complete len:420 (-),score=70.40 TRINITY_DN75015_c0_g1_i1:82-1341(-)
MFGVVLFVCFLFCSWHDAIAVQIDGAFSEDELIEAERLVAAVDKAGRKEYVNQVRNFGVDKDHEGGHRVTFLHEYFKKKFPTLVARLWDVAKAASEKQGWATPPALGSAVLPGLRCLESIKYFAAPDGSVDEAAENATTSPASLGWHYDGHTLVTVAVMLSRPQEDFQGGEVHVERRSPRTQEFETASFTPQRGDAVAWRGWEHHRVNTVTKGLRQVIVAEFWTGPDVVRAENRLSDYEDGYHEAALLDPMSPYIHKQLAWMLFERESWDEAAATIAKAVANDPSDTESLVVMGRVHQQRGRVDEALSAYNAALKLQPDDPVALLAAADHANQRGDVAEMERCYLKAIDVGAWQALEPLGDARSAQGRHREAAEHYAQFLTYEPGDDVIQDKLKHALHLAEHGEAGGSWWSLLRGLLPW